MRGVAALVLILALPVWGCERETAAPLGQDTFVEVMVSLRRASREAEGQEDFEARKAEILRQAGVTDADMRAYARIAAGNAPELAEAYDSIAARLQRYEQPD